MSLAPNRTRDLAVKNTYLYLQNHGHFTRNLLGKVFFEVDSNNNRPAPRALDNCRQRSTITPVETAANQLHKIANATRPQGTMDLGNANKMDDSGDGSTTDMDITQDEINDNEMVSKLWARELYEMNTEDREAATNELHGVESRYDASKHESPENHYRALVEFENELNKSNSGLSDKLKQGYLRALSLNSSYVLSSDFRLRFLRTEFFDIPKAVRRFCNWLNMLVEYYGEVSLVRQIFLSDLSKPERKLLKQGCMQLSPSRYPLGRRVLFFLRDSGAGESARRVALYLMCIVLAEDETTQRNGFVVVTAMNELSVQETMKSQMSRNFFPNFFASCPVRVSAIHLCFPDTSVYRIVFPIILLAIGHTGRKLVKVHLGTRMENDYSLNTFGIRPDDVPKTYSGTIKTRQHVRMLKVRAAMDDFVGHQCVACANGDYRKFYSSDQKFIKPFPHIQCPENNAVLFHKNGVAWEFPGNVKFREFLEENLAYMNADLENRSSKSGFGIEGTAVTIEKKVLIDRIIRLCSEKKFQFLLHDEINHWYDEIRNPAVLRRYIGFAMRGRQRRMGAKRQRQGWDNDKEGNKAVFTNMNGEETAWGPDFCQSGQP